MNVLGDLGPHSALSSLCILLCCREGSGWPPGTGKGWRFSLAKLCLVPASSGRWDLHWMVSSQIWSCASRHWLREWAVSDSNWVFYFPFRNSLELNNKATQCPPPPQPPRPIQTHTHTGINTLSYHLIGQSYQVLMLYLKIILYFFIHVKLYTHTHTHTLLPTDYMVFHLCSILSPPTSPSVPASEFCFCKEYCSFNGGPQKCRARHSFMDILTITLHMRQNLYLHSFSSALFFQREVGHPAWSMEKT